MIEQILIDNYKSIRSLQLPLRRLNVLKPHIVFRTDQGHV